jgi:hypothetical protein
MAEIVTSSEGLIWRDVLLAGVATCCNLWSHTTSWCPYLWEFVLRSGTLLLELGSIFVGILETSPLPKRSRLMHLGDTVISKSRSMESNASKTQDSIRNLGGTCNPEGISRIHENSERYRDVMWWFRCAHDLCLWETSVLRDSTWRPRHHHTWGESRS